MEVLSSELKAKLSYYLRLVREKGAVVTVLDRQTPVARLVPIESSAPRLEIREAAKSWEALEPLPDSGVSIAVSEAALSQERKERS
ncbi:MAG: type II toxin-antitoxin system prevent-host-death family antitoxin [Myxococcota bacterium]